MSNSNVLNTLLSGEIKDLYSAEKQLIAALPKMAKGATDPELKKAFENHLAETKHQLSRLEKVAEMLEIKPSGKTCKGMQGVIEEGSEALQSDGSESQTDLEILFAAGRVEHYEMAGYHAAIALAEQLNLDEAVTLLSETLTEENAADELLREIASRLMEVESEEPTVQSNRPKAKAAKV